MVFKELEIGDLLPTLVKPNQLTVALVRGNSTDMNQFVNSIKKQLKRQIVSAVNQLLSKLTTTWLLSKICTVISAIMPPPNFYRKYAPPFFQASFLKILWQECSAFWGVVEGVLEH